MAQDQIKSFIDSSVVRFIIVGLIGFIIDSSIMLTLMSQGISPFIARVPSFATALLVTWLLNRNYSFSKATVITKKHVEAAAYLTVQSLGAGVNYITFVLVLSLPFISINNPVIALIIAALAGMTFNFFGLKKIVFR